MALAALWCWFNIIDGNIDHVSIKSLQHFMPEERKRLLAALIKDRNQVKAALNYIAQQKQCEEKVYWETGVMPDVARAQHLQNSYYIETLFTQHELTVKAYYDAIDPQ
jgi:hypothetical protein